LITDIEPDVVGTGLEEEAGLAPSLSVRSVGSKQSLLALKRRGGFAVRTSQNLVRFENLANWIFLRGSLAFCQRF
jgi:hypothetical protein